MNFVAVGDPTSDSVAQSSAFQLTVPHWPVASPARQSVSARVRHSVVQGSMFGTVGLVDSNRLQALRHSREIPQKAPYSTIFTCVR